MKHKEKVKMSKDWVTDITSMHSKFGVQDVVQKMDKDLLLKWLSFRMDFIHEEFQETLDAIARADAPEVVDGLIDICVVAIGTLQAAGVDVNEAWDRVHRANMSKVPGVKPERHNPLGLPDLIKPEGWTAPNHDDNTGIL